MDKVIFYFVNEKKQDMVGENDEEKPCPIDCEQASTGPTPRELSFGEKVVGLTFNPANNPEVDKIKRLYAEIIDTCRKEIGERVYLEFEGKLLDEAIIKAVAAQIAAVKFITWNK